ASIEAAGHLRNAARDCARLIRGARFCTEERFAPHSARFYNREHNTTRRTSMAWTTPTLVEICVGLEINGYLPAEFYPATPPQFLTPNTADRRNEGARLTGPLATIAGGLSLLCAWSIVAAAVRRRSPCQNSSHKRPSRAHPG